MSKATDISKINEHSPYYDMTTGNQIYGGGDWEKCTQCLLCTPVCPDSCIPVKDGKREDFDLDHCKGCGICERVCSFGAITMKEGI